jgi:hydroxymethylpyrimidine pyrophosphatase-like HAD family hydrolase
MVKGFIFDLDGTIYLGDELIPGADRVIHRLRKEGVKVVFLSNKPLLRLVLRLPVFGCSRDTLHGLSGLTKLRRR